MLFFLCSLRRDQRVSVSTDGLCYREKLEGIPIYHTDCLNQQGRTSLKLIDHAFQNPYPPLLHTLLELSLETVKPGADANVQHVCEGIHVCTNVSPNVS
ncbi:hypothetical protein PO909_006987 [Leuciscus waleckii]